MQRLVLTGVLIAIATPARADRTVERWVGTWTGKATWKGCSLEGPAELEVNVEWGNNEASIDASVLYEGLGDYGLSADGKGGLRFADEQEVTIALTRVGKKTTLRFSTPAQCTMTAKITRVGSGIEACDELLALGIAATSCKVPLDDDPADQRDAWSALRGKARDRAAAHCTKRATALHTKLVIEGCVPPDDDPAELPACRDVWKTAERVMRCDRVPAQIKQRTLESVADLRRSLRFYATRADLGDLATTSCTEVAALLRERLDVLHCP